MSKACDFYKVLNILRQLDAGVHQCGNDKEMAQLLYLYANGTVIPLLGGQQAYRLYSLTDGGYTLLDTLCNEETIRRVEEYAQSQGRTPTLSNFAILVAEVKAASQQNTSLTTLPHLNQNRNKEVRKTSYSQRVFIVHGRNLDFRTEVKTFIENVGLEPIILAEQANMGRTIIEKIEEYSDVGYAVILYTGCDVGMLIGSSNYSLRARQNVVLEHGYFMGKLGRDRVSAIVESGVETPNDISGILFIEKDNNWQEQLQRELREAGYNV